MSEQLILAMVGGILGGSAVAALINQAGEMIREKRRRKYDNEDQENSDIKEIKRGLRYVMFDRIRHIGNSYIQRGWVEYDDRRILNEMHDSYHNGLGGNGDLDIFMREINELPLKKKEDKQ